MAIKRILKSISYGVVFTTALASVFVPRLVSGQPPEPFQVVDDPARLGPVSGLQVEGQVLNGAPAQRGHWPATFIFLTGQGSCTATAVGRRVVLTAAHCVPHGQGARLIVGDRDLTLSCYHNPGYPRDISADFALCLASAPLPNLGFGFERINTDPNQIQNRGRLMLLGYGCTTNQGQRDFGNLYQGTATIADRSLWSLYILTVGGAAVCFGDSGGGAYWVESEQQITGRRLLVAVNSRGDISTNSWLSNTATTAFIDWASTWARDRNVAICGVYGNEDNCRPA